jgi:hypothetical protein
MKTQKTKQRLISIKLDFYNASKDIKQAYIRHSERLQRLKDLLSADARI